MLCMCLLWVGTCPCHVYMWRWGALGVRVVHWGGGLLIVHCTHIRLAGLQSSPDCVPPLSSPQECWFTCVCYMPALPGFCASHLGPSSHLYNKRFAYRATSLAPNCIKQPVISWFRFDIYLFLTSRQGAIITVLLNVEVISKILTMERQSAEAVATGLQVSRAVSELGGRGVLFKLFNAVMPRTCQRANSGQDC